MPELQKTYEAILNKKFDRRNFRKKLISQNLIYDTEEEVYFVGKKKAKLYKFVESENNKEIFTKFKAEWNHSAF